MTPLLFAGRQGDLESARGLVDAGADVNLTSAEGSNALLLAILNGHYELAAYLLGKGSDPNAAAFRRTTGSKPSWILPV